MQSHRTIKYNSYKAVMIVSIMCYITAILATKFNHVIIGLIFERFTEYFGDAGILLWAGIIGYIMYDRVLFTPLDHAFKCLPKLKIKKLFHHKRS